jgi:hypothetical protein
MAKHPSFLETLVQPRAVTPLDHELLEFREADEIKRLYHNADPVKADNDIPLLKAVDAFACDVSHGLVPGVCNAAGKTPNVKKR